MKDALEAWLALLTAKSPISHCQDVSWAICSPINDFASSFTSSAQPVPPWTSVPFASLAYQVASLSYRLSHFNDHQGCN